MSGGQRVIEVLDVQVDLEAGLEIAREDHRGFGVHDGGTREAALDGLKDLLRIDARPGGQEHRLRKRRDVERHDDLVGQLRGIARADLAAPHRARAHDEQEVLVLLEHLLVAADHDGQRAVDGLGLAAGYRRVDHVDALCLAGGAHFLGDLRRDGAHVDDGGAGLRALEHAVFTQYDFEDLWAVRHHRDDGVTVFGDFLGRGRS